MDNELENLRSEVRRVAELFDDSLKTRSRFSDGWRTVRAELLRLAARNAELEAKATRDHAWISDLLTDNKRAEAELAALKARIAEAPVASVRVDDRMHVSIGARSNAVDFVPLHTKHVALVKVEE